MIDSHTCVLFVFFLLTEYITCVISTYEEVLEETRDHTVPLTTWVEWWFDDLRCNDPIEKYWSPLTRKDGDVGCSMSILVNLEPILCWHYRLYHHHSVCNVSETTVSFRSRDTPLFSEIKHFDAFSSLLSFEFFFVTSEKNIEKNFVDLIRNQPGRRRKVFNIQN